MGKTQFSRISNRGRDIVIVLACAVLGVTLAGGGTLHAQAAPAAEMATGSAPVASVGTGFTYQGRLTEGGNPANGQYDFRFTLFNALTGGSQVGSQVSLTGQAVAGGLFTVSLDFGNAFQGDERYLQIEVRQTGGSTYTLLAPRQPLTPAPYALSLRPGATISGTLASPILAATNMGSNAAVSGASNSGNGGQFTSVTGTGLLAIGGNGAYSTGTASNGVGLWGVANTGTTAKGVYGTSTSGYGVYGSSTATNGTGLYGVANTGTSAQGVLGSSSAGTGVYGLSTSAYGGQFISTSGTALHGSGANGILGAATASGGYGVLGQANIGTTAKGIYGSSSSGFGVYGVSTGTDTAGVFGVSNTGTSAKGVYGLSTNGSGVYGMSTNGSGVYGNGYSGVTGTGTIYGVHGVGGNGAIGVRGDTGGAVGVWGESGSYVGLYGATDTNSSGFAVFATGGAYAGYFDGNVDVTGSCCSAGMGTYKIDDPLDPQHKFLNQSAVESPDMLDIYNGNVTLDANGTAQVELPQWFVQSNRDFRYQLTSIGAPGPDLYVAEKVSNGGFKIAGGQPGAEVSWQITGTRNDPYAQANKASVEQAKPADEQGKYLHPEVYGQPETSGIGYSENQKVREKATPTGQGQTAP